MIAFLMVVVMSFVLTIVRYYDASKNPEQGELPGVPLADLDEETWEALPKHLQASIDAHPMYRKTKPDGWEKIPNEQEREIARTKADHDQNPELKEASLTRLAERVAVKKVPRGSTASVDDPAPVVTETASSEPIPDSRITRQHTGTLKDDLG